VQIPDDATRHEEALRQPQGEAKSEVDRIFQRRRRWHGGSVGAHEAGWGGDDVAAVAFAEQFRSRAKRQA
jgi:hypothetical protein